MQFPDFLKNLLFGSGASSGVRNFKYRRGVAPSVLFFGMAAFAALAAVVAFGKDNPLAETVCWMIFWLTLVISAGTWVFAHFNPHDSLEGKIRADHLQAMRNLSARHPEVIEHGSAEPIRNPAALRAETSGDEVAKQ